MTPTVPCERPDVDRLLEDVARSLVADFDPESLAGLPLPDLDDVFSSANGAEPARPTDAALVAVLERAGVLRPETPVEDASANSSAYVPLEPTRPHRSAALSDPADPAAPESPAALDDPAALDASAATEAPAPLELLVADDVSASEYALAPSKPFADALPEVLPVPTDAAESRFAAEPVREMCRTGEEDDFGAGLDLDETPPAPESHVPPLAFLPSAAPIVAASLPCPGCADEPSSMPEPSVLLEGDDDLLDESWDTSDTVVIGRSSVPEVRSFAAVDFSDADHSSESAGRADRSVAPDLEESVAQIAVELLDLAERIDVAPNPADEESDAVEGRLFDETSWGTLDDDGRPATDAAGAADEAPAETWMPAPCDAVEAEPGSPETRAPHVPSAADEAGIAAVAWASFAAAGSVVEDESRDDFGPGTWDDPMPMSAPEPPYDADRGTLPWALEVPADRTDAQDVAEALPVDAWETCVPAESCAEAVPCAASTPCPVFVSIAEREATAAQDADVLAESAENEMPLAEIEPVATTDPLGATRESSVDVRVEDASVVEEPIAETTWSAAPAERCEEVSHAAEESFAETPCDAGPSDELGPCADLEPFAESQPQRREVAASADRTTFLVVGLGLALGMGAAAIALWGPFGREAADVAAVAGQATGGVSEARAMPPVVAERESVGPSVAEHSPAVRQPASSPVEPVSGEETVPGASTAGPGSRAAADEPPVVAASSESAVTQPAVAAPREAEPIASATSTVAPTAETAPPVAAVPDPAAEEERAKLLAEIEQLRAEVERQRRRLEAEQLRRELESAPVRPAREVAAAPAPSVAEDGSSEAESGPGPAPRANPDPRPAPAPRAEPKPKSVESPARPGPRTLEYWNALNALIAKESEMRRPPSAGLTALNAAEFLERRVAAGEFASKAIRALDAAEVDADAKSLAADLAAWYAEEASVAKQAQSLLGASAEARRGTQGQRYQEAERRHNARVTELNRQAEQVRERLARKYGLKFPPLL